MNLKSFIKNFGIDKRSGYSIIDVLDFLRIISKKPMGRILLIRELDLGEATVKTMIKRLKNEGLLKESTKGQALTAKGSKIAESLNKKVSPGIPIEIPAISKKRSVVLVVKHAAKKVCMGIEQRDEGMKLGVDVTTLVFDRDGIKFPKTNEYLNNVGMEKVKKLFTLKDSDVIIISSGNDEMQARKGALAAALTLI